MFRLCFDLPKWQPDFEIKQHLWDSSFLAIGKYINLARYRQIIETERAEKPTLDE